MSLYTLRFIVRFSLADLAGSAALLLHDRAQRHGRCAGVQYPVHASRTRAANLGVPATASVIQLLDRELRATYGTPRSRTYYYTRGKRPFVAAYQRGRGASVRGDNGHCGIGSNRHIDAQVPVVRCEYDNER